MFRLQSRAGELSISLTTVVRIDLEQESHYGREGEAE
jgi:hypothetical protein